MTTNDLDNASAYLSVDLKGYTHQTRESVSRSEHFVDLNARYPASGH